MAEACFYPICSCYPDTSTRCEHEVCAWPTCDCGIEKPRDDYARCAQPIEAIRRRDAESGVTWFQGPASFTAQAARDRRILLEFYDRRGNFPLRSVKCEKSCALAVSTLVDGLRRKGRPLDEIEAPVLFKRNETSPWIVWPRDSHPPAPSPDDLRSVMRTTIGGRTYADWGGVHFFAIRYSHFVWDAVNLWSKP